MLQYCRSGCSCTSFSPTPHREDRCWCTHWNKDHRERKKRFVINFCDATLQRDIARTAQSDDTYAGANWWEKPTEDDCGLAPTPRFRIMRDLEHGDVLCEWVVTCHCGERMGLYRVEGSVLGHKCLRAQCGYCDSPKRKRELSERRHAYVCLRFSCGAFAYAHTRDRICPSDGALHSRGQPFGIPASAHCTTLRHKVYEDVDALRTLTGFPRGSAHSLLPALMRLQRPSSPVHIHEFDADDCRHAIDVLDRFQRGFRRGEPSPVPITERGCPLDAVCMKTASYRCQDATITTALLSHVAIGRAECFWADLGLGWTLVGSAGSVITCCKAHKKNCSPLEDDSRVTLSLAFPSMMARTQDKRDGAFNNLAIEWNFSFLAEGDSPNDTSADEEISARVKHQLMGALD